MKISTATIRILRLISVVLVPISLAACATLPFPSGDAGRGRPKSGGALYQSILDWQKVSSGHPDYQSAQENIRKAEQSLKKEIESRMDAAREAIRLGDLDEAAQIYRETSFLDPRRTDLKETSERHETAVLLIKRHEAERDRQAQGKDWPSVARKDRIILTILPGYGPAAAHLKKTQTTIKELSQKRYEEGRRLLDSGNRNGARREFLATLYLDPSHEEALSFFWSSRTAEDIPELSPDDCIVHVIQPGESMSMLAERYYGDKYKFPVIASFNNISDATKIQVGQEIRIPRLQSLQKGRTLSPSMSDSTSDYTKPLLEQARDFLRENAYHESIEEAKKVLTGDPDNSDAQNILIEAYYQQGYDFLKKNLFEQSLYYLGKVLELVPDYRDIQSLFKKAQAGLEKFIDELYKEGITLYREQLLPKALEKWEKVLKLDPGHEGAKKYSEKARQLLEKLKEIE